MSNNAHELSNRLLNALDNNYNVVDMHTVNEIISILEKFNITKELLETTRLGKHVNELRRKTSDPTLARRAKVLVKRWRDLVIPTVASPGHAGLNQSSVERQVRRLGGTPLTSPALCRVASPAVNSPRLPSRPAWGGYESDSQDVILVDDDPPAPPLPMKHLKPLTPPVKRPISPAPVHDEKKAKRDKKPKKRRGHSRAGSGAETTAGAVVPAPPAAPIPAALMPAPAPTPAPAPPPAAWGARNGSGAERRRNGYRREGVDPYAALVNKMPPVGAKKVKTTKELLEEIQSRGSKPATSPASLGSPASPDVMFIEPDAAPIKADSPLRNGGERASPAPPAAPAPTPAPAPAPVPAASPAHSPMRPLEDEREYHECTCAGSPRADCPAARARVVRPLHVQALHHTLMPGVNGTRAPLVPHRFAVREPRRADRPELFASVVPLYNYSDYADDYCAKNLSRVPFYSGAPWTEFAPSPPPPPAPPSPPPPRPYPFDFDIGDEAGEVKAEPKSEPASPAAATGEGPVAIEAEMVGVPSLEPSERLKAPLLSSEDERQFAAGGSGARADAATSEFARDRPAHRTVERTKGAAEPAPAPDPEPASPLDGRALVAQCERARASIPYEYEQLLGAPELTLPADEADAEMALVEALERAEAEPDAGRDELGRPERSARFAEWHECARLGDLLALPYVVID